jgi:hypothetical protein
MVEVTFELGIVAPLGFTSSVGSGNNELGRVSDSSHGLSGAARNNCRSSGGRCNLGTSDGGYTGSLDCGADGVERGRNCS